MLCAKIDLSGHVMHLSCFSPVCLFVLKALLALVGPFSLFALFGICGKVVSVN
jgi:hypothetical protein